MPGSNANIFFKFYANLPINIRREVILNIKENEVGPITWDVAYREISNNTKLGEIILNKLFDLKFIPVDNEQ